MEERTVLVTGIGGNVGQGILRNIASLGYNIKLIGTNTERESAGNHLVNAFYKVPYGVDNSYIPAIQDIIQKEEVDLIIPSTDFEVDVLSKNRLVLDTIIACSDHQVTQIYIDKYQSSQFHEKHNIPFALSCLPSQFSDKYLPAIAKPRLGRGSRGLIKNYQGLENLSDSEYLIQKMYSGVEVTSAAYVSYRTKKLIGFITFERTLDNGATTFCKVEKAYDSTIGKIINQIVSETDIVGSFNVQMIVNEEREVFPFEINCRVSGTNSIRSHFGFEDVRYTIEELLYNKSPSTLKIREGVAFRYLSDVIYVDGVQSGDSSDSFKLF